MLLPVSNGLSAAVSTTHSLGDTVWINTNNDGIQNETATSFAGITVNLLDSTGIRLATTTDENGNYIFTGLTNGDYTLEFTNVPSIYVGTKLNTTTDGLRWRISFNWNL